MTSGADMDTPFKSGDGVWVSEGGTEYAAEVGGVFDDGFIYEVVMGNRVTTAQLHQLRER